ncbi:hypothetical protein NDU88_004225 [Pleurodeles waltl]|uniref:Uncharacterized protein n=1 Tax=Pleurodeles waltl TaxID=8319 RepID=A0AAV7PF01_PLEWA|nr:hypothetical protein NDU88_004225 [Pleurodeles waltl]
MEIWDQLISGPDPLQLTLKKLQELIRDQEAKISQLKSVFYDDNPGSGVRTRKRIYFRVRLRASSVLAKRLLLLDAVALLEDLAE